APWHQLRLAKSRSETAKRPAETSTGGPFAYPGRLFLVVLLGRCLVGTFFRRLLAALFRGLVARLGPFRRRSRSFARHCFGRRRRDFLDLDDDARHDRRRHDRAWT